MTSWHYLLKLVQKLNEIFVVAWMLNIICAGSYAACMVMKNAFVIELTLRFLFVSNALKLLHVFHSRISINSEMKMSIKFYCTPKTVTIIFLMYIYTSHCFMDFSIFFFCCKYKSMQYIIKKKMYTTTRAFNCLVWNKWSLQCFLTHTCHVIVNDMFKKNEGKSNFFGKFKNKWQLNL